MRGLNFFLILLILLPVVSLSKLKKDTVPKFQLEQYSDHEVMITCKTFPDSLLLERRQAAEKVFHEIAMIDPGSNRYLDTALSVGDTLVYRLRPLHSRYINQYGNEQTIVLEFPPPAVPLLTRIGVDCVQVSLSQKDSFPVKILVERVVDGIFQEIGALDDSSGFFDDYPLSVDEFYFYRLIRKGTMNLSAPSPVDSIYLHFPPPNSPQITFINDHTVHLSWDYPLEYPCEFEIEKNVMGMDDTEVFPCFDQAWQDTLVPYDQLTFYRIRAKKGDNTSEFSHDVKTRIRLHPVQKFSIDDTLDEFVHLAWKDTSRVAAFYIVQRSLGGTDFTSLDTLQPEKREYLDTLAGRGVLMGYRLLSSTSSGITKYSPVVTQFIPDFTAGMNPVSIGSDSVIWYLDRNEMTVAQYRQFCEETGTTLPESPGYPGMPFYWRTADNYPAVNVSWLQAVRFCNWRSVKVGLEPAYNENGDVIPGIRGYRLPTKRLIVASLPFADSSLFNFLGDEDGALYPMQIKDNPSKINHLLGNVWEWAEDSLLTGSHLVLGGGYTTPANLAGPLPQFSYPENWTSPAIGFRCALPPVTKQDDGKKRKLNEETVEKPGNHANSTTSPPDRPSENVILHTN